MESLARYAERILETARAGGQDWTVLISRSGVSEMLTENDWPLDSLLRERGALMAFRVTHGVAAIQVEGRSLRERCCLESVRPWLPGAPRADRRLLLPGLSG